MLEIIWKSGLVWLSRPLDKVLDLWANFGPLRAKISKIGWGTPTFYWSPRLYLPIGIQNWPYSGWDISSHFLSWVKFSGETCDCNVVAMICLAHLRTLSDMNINYMGFDNKKLVQSSVLFWIELINKLCLPPM